MTRMPGAVWRPIHTNYGLIRANGHIDRTARRPKGTNACIFHVDAMNASTLVNWFNNPAARASSHLYVLKTGVIEQMIDLDHVSWCNGAGDLRAITVETQGRDGEPWTPEQVEANARIARFVNGHYGVPLRLMEDSRTTTEGLGWHRLGIEGNFRGSELQRRHLVPGGERWSKSRGKTCPGDERIAQMPAVLTRAQQLAGFGVGGITIPPTTTVQEDDMPLTDSEKRELKGYADTAAENVVKKLNEGFARNGQYTAGVWTHANPVSPNTDMRGWLVSTYRKVAEVEATQVGLVGALAAVGGGEQFDEAKLLAGVRKAAQEGVAAAIDSIDTTVTITQEA